MTWLPRKSHPRNPTELFQGRSFEIWTRFLTCFENESLFPHLSGATFVLVLPGSDTLCCVSRHGYMRMLGHLLAIKSIVQINSPKQRSGIIWTPFQVWIGKPQHEMMERKGFHTRNPKAHHTWSTSLSLRKSGCKRLLRNGRAWIEPRVQWRRTEAFKTSNNAEQKIFVSQESDRENEWQTTASQTTQTKAECQKEGKRARDFWRFYVWYGDPASDLNWLC